MDPECNLVTLNGLWIIDYDMVAQRVFLFKVLLESVVEGLIGVKRLCVKVWCRGETSTISLAELPDATMNGLTG